MKEDNNSNIKEVVGSLLNRLIREKLNKETLALKEEMEEMGLTDI